MRGKTGTEQHENFFVGGLRENLVITGHSVEIWICQQSNYIIRHTFQSFNGTGSSYGNGNGNMIRALLASRQNGSFSGCAGGQTIINN